MSKLNLDPIMKTDFLVISLCHLCFLLSFLRSATLRAGLRRKENFLPSLFGTAPQALLAFARVSLGAQAVP